MIFYFKKENSKIIRQIIEVLSTIIDEIEMTIVPEGLRIYAMDPSRICLLKLEIDNDDFDSFECKKETKICLNLEDLNKILKRSSANDHLEIFQKEEENKIRVCMKKAEGTKKRNFSLTLLDLEMEEIHFEKLIAIEYLGKIKLETSIIDEAIKDGEIYGESLFIKAKEKEGLIIEASGQIGEMTYELQEEDLIESEINGTQSGRYGITFLKAIIKLAPITEEFKLSALKDHPLFLQFKLLEGGVIDYYLAPRVDSEEDIADPDDMDEF